jgi:hypothetical protein
MGVYLKYANVLQQLIVPKLEDLRTQVQATQDGGNKLPAKELDSNFLLLVCRLGRVPWQRRMASGWRGDVWVLKKSGAFRDSAQNRFQTSAGIHIYKVLQANSLFIYEQIHIKKG